VGTAALKAGAAQIRTCVLNGEWRGTLERWNPGMEAVA